MLEARARHNNTLKIIDHYKPKIFVIENPAYGRIWEYIANVIGFNIPYENLTYYNNYGYKVQKPNKIWKQYRFES